MEKFEASFPFDNITIGGFREIAFGVEEKSEEGKKLGYVMFDKFKESITQNNTVWA